MNLFLIFGVLIIILLIVIFWNQSEAFTVIAVGHRPYLGDYLPTVGEVPTGEDGRVLEADT